MALVGRGRREYERVVQLSVIIGNQNATGLAVYIEAKAEALLVKIGRASSLWLADMISTLVALQILRHTSPCRTRQGILKWVQPKDEAEICEAFAKTMTVRKLDSKAQQLADTYFLKPWCEFS